MMGQTMLWCLLAAALGALAGGLWFRRREKRTLENLDRMLDQHMSGKRDNWRQIWCVFIFLVWYDEYFVKR